MAPVKGEGGERRHSNAGVNPPKAEDNLKRDQPAMAETESDGEEEYSGCCLFRSRSLNRKLGTGASYARLDGDDPETTNANAKVKGNAGKVPRSLVTEIFCCCGPDGAHSDYAVVAEVRSVEAKWDGDANEEDHYRPPYWRQLVRKLTSQGLVRRPARGPDWLSYDAHAYQMNFDDGCGRDDCISYLFTDEKDDAATRARAMHAALVRKFASHGTAPGSPLSPVLSPWPVKMVSKEETERSKEGFVPIWQRRQGAPPIKLDLRQRSGPMD